MYFKYYPMESDELAIQKVEFVRIDPLVGGGFMLVPCVDERKCEIIDSAIQRLAGLLCEPREVKGRIYATEDRREFGALGPVWNHMGYDDPWYDGLKWYETREEANAEMERIAEAIARGDRLYDLTKEASSNADR